MANKYKVKQLPKGQRPKPKASKNTWGGKWPKPKYKKGK